MTSATEQPLIIKEATISLKRKHLEDRSLSITSTTSTDAEENVELEEKFDHDSSSSNSESEVESSEEDHTIKKRKVTVTTTTTSTTTTEPVTTERTTVVEVKTLPTHQSALVITSFEEPFQVTATHPVSAIEPHEVLIENKFIGLNPIDWKGKKYRFGVYSFPWVQGRESSGVIRAVGSEVEGLEVGDEVFMVSTSYRDLKTSTFQEYTVFDGRLVWKKPEGLDLKECGGIGVGLITASSVLEELGVGLFSGEQSTEDKAAVKDKSILVWGASSGVGSYVVQLAKAAGYGKIIAVTSLKHEEALRKSGATHVLDRFKTVDELKIELAEIAPNGINDGVDVVSKQTSDIVVELLNVNKDNISTGKNFVAVVSAPSKTLDAKLLEGITVKTVLIKKFHEDIEHGVRLVKKTHELLHKNHIQPQRNIKLYKGVDGILKGLEDLEEHGASFEKYVVEL